jgi:hypothetical protein
VNLPGDDQAGRIDIEYSAQAEKDLPYTARLILFRKAEIHGGAFAPARPADPGGKNRGA